MCLYSELGLRINTTNNPWLVSYEVRALVAFLYLYIYNANEYQRAYLIFSSQIWQSVLSHRQDLELRLASTTHVQHIAQHVRGNGTHSRVNLEPHVTNGMHVPSPPSLLQTPTAYNTAVMWINSHTSGGWMLNFSLPS